MRNLMYSASKEWTDKFKGQHIEGKPDIIARLLLICKYILSKDVCKKGEDISILVDKNSRVYVFDNDDYFYSFAFPLSIHEESDGGKSLFYQGIPLSSAMLNFLSSQIADKNRFPTKINFSEASEYSLKPQEAKDILAGLMMFDSGYVRYENDPVRASKNHPQFHLDWFYENISQAKTGLRTKIDKKQFIELLSIEKACWKLIPAKEK